jgi:hypothetical protein
MDIPFEIYFAKYASYEGHNFIISIGYRFDNLPDRFVGRTLIKTIVIGGLGQSLIESILSDGIANLSTGNLAEISGPYSIFYESDSNLKDLDVAISMIRIENFTLQDWSWVIMNFKNKPGLPSIPLNGELWLNNTQLYQPIDTIIWYAGPFDDREKIPFLYTIEFYESRETLIYAIAEIDEMPPYLKIAMDYTQAVDGKNITLMYYESDTYVNRMEYYAYEFPFYKSTGNLEDYNVTHVLFRDLPLSFHFEVTSDVGRNLNSTISTNPTAGVLANVIDNVIVRVARRFYRIGESLKTLAVSITTLPLRKGWAELEVETGKIGLVEIYRSSGQYVTMENDYISFLNETNENYPGFLVDFPIAAKIRELRYMKASFKDDTEITFKHRGGRPLSIIFVDGEDFAFAEFSDMPSEISIIVTDNLNTFKTFCVDSPRPAEDCDFSSDEALANRIESFRFYSKSKKQYMELIITDIPNYMTISNIGSAIIFDTVESDYIGSFEFAITDNNDLPMPKLTSDHYAYIDIQPEYSASSGKLTGVQHLAYDPSGEGKTELKLRNESEFDIRMINNLDERIDATIILDPLPSSFSMKLPGAINSSIKRLPDVINITGEVDFSNVVFAIANLGNDIIGIMNNISHNVVDLIGAVSSNLSFSYDLEGFGSTLDIIASIEKGPREMIPDLSWSHGIIMAADEKDGEEILKGNIYLQGLPPKANFTSNFGEEDIYLNVNFKNYRPKYDWLYVERNGLQNRNLDFYVDNLRDGIDLSLEVNLSTNISIGGKTNGMIDIQCFDSFTNNPYDLGTLHVNLHKFDYFMSKTEVYISEIPSTFHMDVSMFKNTEVSYRASDSIEYFFIDIAKKLNGEWFSSFVLFHDLPTWFEIDMRSNSEFTIDKPIPLQGLPDLSISSGAKTMDIVAQTTGRVSGQRGNVNLQIENVNSLYGKMTGDSYRLSSSGLDFIMLRISDLPLMDNFKVHKLELIAENLVSVQFDMKTLFGVYPIFELSDLEGSAFELNLENEMELFGSKRHVTVTLVDVTYTSLGSSEIPSETPIYNDGVNVKMESSKRHVLIPAPMTSLLLTSFN